MESNDIYDNYVVGVLELFQNGSEINYYTSLDSEFSYTYDEVIQIHSDVNNKASSLLKYADRLLTIYIFYDLKDGLALSIKSHVMKITKYE